MTARLTNIVGNDIEICKISEYFTYIRKKSDNCVVSLGVSYVH